MSVHVFQNKENPSVNCGPVCQHEYWDIICGKYDKYVSIMHGMVFLGGRGLLLFWLVGLFLSMVFLCNPGIPETCSADHACLKLRDPPASAS